jgi:hypothetical protein
MNDVRRLRRYAEAIYGVVWRIPELRTGYPGIPLGPAAASLGGRAACLGAAPGRTAASLFVPLNPAVVAAAVDKAWARTTPAELDAARVAACERFLASCPAIGGLDGARVEQCTEWVRAAPVDGHPMYASLLAVEPPASPLTRLWRACELIRERRGDSHRNAWCARGLTAPEIVVLTEAWQGEAPGSTAATLGWGEQEVAAAAAASLRARGLLGSDGITDDGRRLREAIEADTDAQELPLLDGHDPAEVAALLAWLRDLARAIAAH